MITLFKEKEFGYVHEVTEGAPCDWSRNQGTTHTLHCPAEKRIGLSGTRPAILKKTVLMVGLDEVEDAIVWHRWQGKIHATF